MMKLKNGLFVVLFCFLAVSSAWALSLHQAKSEGWVHETGNGYLAVSSHAPMDAKRLTRIINHKRKRKYLYIAKKYNVSVHYVEKLAGEKVRRRRPSHPRNHYPSRHHSD